MVSAPRPAAPLAREEQGEGVAYNKLIWVAPLAAIVASVANLAIYALGRAGGMLTDGVVLPMNGQPLSATPVVASTVAGVIGATIVYALLGRFVRRPISTFRIVALVALILSVASPFGLPDADLAYRATLLVMHVATAVTSVGLLTTLARRD